jgi:hypothetical protein
VLSHRNRRRPWWPRLTSWGCLGRCSLADAMGSARRSPVPTFACCMPLPGGMGERGTVTAAEGRLPFLVMGNRDVRRREGLPRGRVEVTTRGALGCAGDATPRGFPAHLGRTRTTIPAPAAQARAGAASHETSAAWARGRRTSASAAPCISAQISSAGRRDGAEGSGEWSPLSSWRR